ncbi:MAG: hypothetical protein Q8909_20235 [Bacteroidota bacterium]|nr:hypothetical protein [Bacteroidota bacterium]
MNIEFKKIAKIDYETLNCVTLFDDNTIDRAFGVISDGLINYKLGWQSDILKPKMLNIVDQIYLVGVDQNLAIFDFINGEIVLKLYLDYFFYDAILYNDSILIINELELIKVDSRSFDIIETYGLPDFVEKIEFKDGMIEIHCYEDQILKVK